jgi:hypothetical protein
MTDPYSYAKDYKNICNDNELESLFGSPESDVGYSVYEDDDCLDEMLEG